MARQARAGELKTKITVQANKSERAGNGYKRDDWVTVCTPYCKWVNAYGNDVVEARKLGLGEFATLTLRYTDKITPTCRVLRDNDVAHPFEVISVNDVGARRRWLEVKVSRKAAAL